MANVPCLRPGRSFSKPAMPIKNRILKSLETVANFACLRPLSSRFLSSWCSSTLKRPVRLFYDSTWLREDDRATIGLGPRVSLRRSLIENWRPGATEITEQAAAWWYLWYKPKAGDVIVDIGAGMGEDALLFSSSVGKSGAVFSFEAHPVTARALKKTVEYSNLSNVTVVEAAIYNQRCTIKIEDRPMEAWQENSILTPDGAPPGRTLLIQAFPLDEFEPLQRYDHIDFVKMNIEGAELDALGGMSRTLRKTRHICVACHDFLSAGNPKMKTKAACRRILADAGFAVRDTDPNSPPWQRDHVHGFRA
jgi:FkbM family methyltransferase